MNTKLTVYWRPLLQTQCRKIGNYRRQTQCRKIGHYQRQTQCRKIGNYQRQTQCREIGLAVAVSKQKCRQWIHTHIHTDTHTYTHTSKRDTAVPQGSLQAHTVQAVWSRLKGAVKLQRLSATQTTIGQEPRCTPLCLSCGQRVFAFIKPCLWNNRSFHRGGDAVWWRRGLASQ